MREILLKRSPRLVLEVRYTVHNEQLLAVRHEKKDGTHSFPLVITNDKPEWEPLTNELTARLLDHPSIKDLK